MPQAPSGSLRFFITLILSMYFLWYALVASEPYTILATFNLLIHEAGHWIFSPFGEFIYILGGSLNQILVPAIFVGYFWLRGQKWEASVVMFWLGTNVLEVAHYAGDAVAMQLPLLGGDNVIHDWHYLLSTTHALAYTKEIAGTIWFVGVAITVAGAAIGFFTTSSPES